MTGIALTRWVKFSVALRQQRPHGLLGAGRALTRWVQNRTDLGKCTHQCDEKQGNNSTQALSTTTTTKKILLRVQEGRRTTKEEGSKEEDRQEGPDVQNILRISFFGGFKFNAAMYVRIDRTDC